MNNIEFFIPIISIMFLLVFHILISNLKYQFSQNPIFIMVFSLTIFALTFIIFSLIADSLSTNILIYSISFYSPLVMIYLHLFFGVYKSVSIRVINELLLSKNKKMSLTELEKKYSQVDLIHNRLDLMVKNKWIRKLNNTYSCQKKAVIIVKINIFFKKLYKLPETG